MIAYKYLDQNGVNSTLENNTALLRTPDKYNDPLDCDFYVSEKEKKKAFKLFVNYQCFLGLYSFFFIQKKDPERFKLYGAVVKKNVGFLAKCLQKEKKYKYQADLGAYYAFAKLAMGKDDKDIEKEFDVQIQLALEKVKTATLVSCFSLKSDSILMWSHYAKNHSGGCIEFELDDKVFKKVRYLGRRKTLKLSKIFEYLLGSDFTKEELKIDDKSLYFAAEPIFYKSKVWKYEKEVRCAFSNNDRSEKIDEDSNGVYLKNMSIKKIILGCKADEKFIKDVKKKHRDIPIYRAEIVKGKYKINVAPFKENN